MACSKFMVSPSPEFPTVSFQSSLSTPQFMMCISETPDLTVEKSHFCLYRITTRYRTTFQRSRWSIQHVQGNLRCYLCMLALRSIRQISILMHFTVIQELRFDLMHCVDPIAFVRPWAMLLFALETHILDMCAVLEYPDTILNSIVEKTLEGLRNLPEFKVKKCL